MINPSALANAIVTLVLIGIIAWLVFERRK
jgi:hypothetical protein